MNEKVNGWVQVYDDPKDYCYDCTVLYCWKEKDGYHAIGSTVDTEPFKCDRKERRYKK